MEVKMNEHIKCRLCLEGSNKYVEIFVEDFPHMIELLTGLKVDPNDGLPTVACLQCHQEVKSAMLTRYQIIHSYKVLIEELHSTSDEQITNEEFKSENNLIKQDDLLTNSNSKITVILHENSNIYHNTTSSDYNKNISELENNMKEENFICYENSNLSESCKYSNKNINIDDSKYLLTNAETIIKAAVTNPSEKDEQQFKKLIKKLQGKDESKIKFSRKRKGNKNMPKGSIQFKKKPAEVKTEDIFNIIKPEHIEFLRTVGKKDRVACPICSKEMYGMNMKNHLVTHNYDPVICNICGKASKNAQALQDHINYYHKTTPDRFVCDKCGRGFRVKCALDKHEKKEHGSGEKDFVCTVCGKKFFEKTHLKNHVDITHNKIRPFKCEHCGKDFGRRTQFVTHQLVHTKENRYHCQVCGKGFKIKQTMQTHLKGVHGIEEQKTIFCKICEKGFSSPQGLRAHINSRVHGLEKCDHCSEYITVEYKSIHLKDIHGIEIKNR